ARRPELAALLGSGVRGAAPEAGTAAGTGDAEPSEAETDDLAAVSRMFADLTESHTARLEAMGLST
ncbi:hydroxylase, partial [Streptomonospora algeriensis]